MNFHTPWLGTLPAPYRPNGPALVFADTETMGAGRYGGLRRPYLLGGRRIWDIALCRRNPDGSQEWLEAFVKLANLPYNPDDAEQQQSLAQFGRFHERHPEVSGVPVAAPVLWERELAEQLMHLLRPTPGLEGMAARPVLLGAVPPFEDLGIADLLQRTRHIDSEPPWHYHLWDVETAVAGRLRRAPGVGSEELSRLVGVEPDDYDRHTAVGDVEWCMAMYDALYAPLWRLWAARWRVRRRRARAVAHSAQAGAESRVAA